MARKAILAALTAALLSVSCGLREEANVLRIANWGGAGEDSAFQRKVDEINRRFEASHPGTKIVIEGIPGEYVQKMLLNHIAGAMPDVMVIDASSAAVFIDNGILSDLTPYFEKEPGLREQYWPNVLSVYARGNEQFGLPNDFTPMVLYYNKRLFDEAGVPYPTDSWTREDFRAAAKKLTKKDQYGFAFTNWMAGWIMWLWNGGGDVLTDEAVPKAQGAFDSPQNVETFAFLRDLITKDHSAPTLSEAAGLGVDLFAAGRAAMAVSGHWSLVSYKESKNIKIEDLGVVALPAGPKDRSQTVLYMSAYGIPKAAKNKDLAWEYVRYWASYEVQKDYNATGIAVCARKDVAEETAQTSPIEAAFLPIIPTGRAPYGSFIRGYEIVEKVGMATMDTILNNPDRDIQAELTKAAQRIDREFAKGR